MNIDKESCDATVPNLEKLRQTMDAEFMEIVVLLHVRFDEFGEMAAWLHQKNPHLGESSPMHLISRGRTAKVLDFVEAMLQEDGYL